MTFFCIEKILSFVVKNSNCGINQYISIKYYLNLMETFECFHDLWSGVLLTGDKSLLGLCQRDLQIESRRKQDGKF